ncbi:MAG: LacI family DNA-binding transcriptional regulator [Brooklawnia sp.]|uniref:LacI family DNA-binding transcriptional regulator n=1 Tax=Brooklawnia sp. TaxID=2699740 RepID=UPI003C78D9FE
MEPRAPRVGIKDVAKAAGVSVGTVSHVLNRPEMVSERRRAAVLTAIEELGYVPNHAARQLKAGSSRLIGYLFPNPGNPYFAALNQGIIREAERLDLFVMSATSMGDYERRRHYLSLFEQQRARGIIVSPKHSDVSAELAVSRRGTPVVLASAPDPTGSLCSVASDDFAVGLLACEHLYELGRRKILLVAPGGQVSSEERCRGFEETARERGMEVRLAPVADASIDAGCRIAEGILDGPADQRPDAIFCTSDMLAIGVLQVLVSDNRLQVPADIAVMGCDDLEFSDSTIIPLTSVRQHEDRMGQMAVQLLEEELTAPDHVHSSVLIPPVLMARASTLG